MTERTVDQIWHERMRELELERIDQTWKTPATNEPQIIERIVYVRAEISQAAKRLYFNAGRHAAGATDQVAVAAHNKLKEKGEA
jgi:uncharacterized coiled-coil DUF342 family protein